MLCFLLWHLGEMSWDALCDLTEDWFDELSVHTLKQANRKEWPKRLIIEIKVKKGENNDDCVWAAAPGLSVGMQNISH